MKIEDLDNIEHFELTSPHKGFRTFAVVGPDSKLTVERIKNVEQIAQPSGPPPAAVWNSETGQYEIGTAPLAAPADAPPAPVWDAETGEWKLPV